MEDGELDGGKLAALVDLGDLDVSQSLMLLLDMLLINFDGLLCVFVNRLDGKFAFSLVHQYVE